MAVSRWRNRYCMLGALLLLALPAVSSCQGSDPGAPPGPVDRPPALDDGDRVLMIGNSLTSANNLAAIVEALADSAGLNWQVEAITAGGGSLEDHWARLETRDRVADGDWDVVVLQQGPSSLPESRTHLRHWTAVFDEAIRAAGARTALYEVWPESVRFEVFDRVRDSYALAAADVGGRFLPAGESWRAAWQRDAAAPLYGPDGFHPSEAGSYAAALAIVAGLSDRSPVGWPATLRVGGGTLSVPPPLADLLQASAAEAVAAYRDYRPADQP
ncbi:MAG TPA: SGNH/GDSL hydrolase family protein [Gemmatimonadales bacterium]|nr:SGNH/GDSL hydrolase family protein [Gemmatimonadales bacterium]